MALVGVGFLLVGLLVGAAGLFQTVWLDWRSSANTNASARAFHVAEAGMHHLWSHLEPAPDFADALAWPGGVPPFGDEPGYDVRVFVEGDALRAQSEARVPGGARSRIEAWFRRAETFRPPAALLFAADLARLTAQGEVVVERVRGDAPAVGATGEAAATIVRAAGVPVGVLGSSGFSDSFASLRESPDRIAAGSLPPGIWGSPESPEVVLLAGASSVDSRLEVYGILLADGPLAVGGELVVHGVFLAPAGARIDGTLEVSGVAWLSEEVDISGALVARRDDSALDRADALRPRSLPRTVVLGGCRELW